MNPFLAIMDYRLNARENFSYNKNKSTKETLVGIDINDCYFCGQRIFSTLQKDAIV